MSYYEKRIAHLEARVAEMALQQRMKAIPIEAKLLERIKELKAEVERLTNLKSGADYFKAKEGNV